MTEKERLELLMLYCGIVSFRFHPGVEEPVSYCDCMVEAVRAYKEFRVVARDLEGTWPG